MQVTAVCFESTTYAKQTVTRLKSAVGNGGSLGQNLLYVDRINTTGRVISRCYTEAKTLCSCPRQSQKQSSESTKRKCQKL